MELSAKVEDLVDDTSVWNWRLLRDKLEHDIPTKIQAISPPSRTEMVDDKSIWVGTHTRTFSIATMYEHLDPSGTRDNRNENNHWTGNAKCRFLRESDVSFGRFSIKASLQINTSGSLR